MSPLMVPIRSQTNPINTTPLYFSKIHFNIILPPSLGLNYVGLEVVTAVVMKNSIFWDTMSCSPFKGSRRFAVT
jgi:hypothetical protein